MLMNITPTPLLQHKSLFDILYSKPPSYSSLKVFGCLAYACTTDHGRSKFDLRGRQCVYLGHSSVTKGYILLDIHTHQLFASRYVLFVDSIFPFRHPTTLSSSSSTESSCCIPDSSTYPSF